MNTKNRGDRIQLLQKAVSKHFTAVPAEDRSVLEHLIYACCLEDAKYEEADEAFHRLQGSFFDWNEVRVTTIGELSESLESLPDPAAAAVRLKQTLQSLFESRYSFDLEDMIKMNQGKAVQELEKLNGMSKFVLGYVVQNALGGHSIPVSKTIMHILLLTEIVSDTEAAKGQAPGLERTIPKTKGKDFASCLHQFAIAVADSPGGKLSKTVLKEAGATTKKSPTAPQSSAATVKGKSPAADKKSAAKKTTPKKQAKTQKPAAKGSTAKKSTAKKASPSAPKKSAKKTTKRKPR